MYSAKNLRWPWGSNPVDAESRKARFASNVNRSPSPGDIMSFGAATILFLCRSFLSFPLILTWFNYIKVVGTIATTIDDADPAFTFASAWNTISPSDPCHGCSLKLDSSQVVDGTWRDGSVAGSTASFTFEGSGVSLYGVTNADQTCALTFTLDGGSPVNLDLSAIPQSPTHEYHYELFSASGLSSGSHTLSWTIESSVTNAVAVIDYAVVTSDDVASTIGSASTSSSVSSNLGTSLSTNNKQAVTLAQTGQSSSS
ncbi:hypothetical protein GYMLUDRAFT_932184 [Collybiopsis luxurians FD-317 M1]|nr:hypothetical protein GYMLUDRAFT_932184 [Collybiopsis luxurians FD-317 M1]